MGADDEASPLLERLDRRSPEVGGAVSPSALRFLSLRSEDDDDDWIGQELEVVGVEQGALSDAVGGADLGGEGVGGCRCLGISKLAAVETREYVPQFSSNQLWN